MNRRIVLVLGIVVSSLTAFAGASEAAEYVCAPCGCPNDGAVYTQAGTCPGCGMQLVVKQERRNVAILLFEGVQIIDYTGPYEVLGQVHEFNVYTVSRTGETLTTAMGMSVNPAYSFTTAPAPDILVVPGGAAQTAYEDPDVVSWVAARAEDAEYVMSVCNGAFILAKAGLLDGKKATTFYGLLDDLRVFAPHTEVVNDQRFVDNGKVITSAGLSSGIDASLHLVARVFGEPRAKSLALHLEYNWDPDSHFARGALADLHLPRIDTPDGLQSTLIATGGDRDRWERRFSVTGEMSRHDLAEYIASRITADGGWRRTDAENAASGRSDWISTGGDGGPWKLHAVVEPGESASVLLVTFHVERAG